jgi:hypothetical protein
MNANIHLNGRSVLTKSDEIEWIRIDQAIRAFGIGRSTLFKLIADQRVKSCLLKSRKDNLRGLRLISVESLREFLNELAKPPTLSEIP